MKTTNAILLIFIGALFFFSMSCTKKRTVHFHGRVTYHCNNNGVKNLKLQIIRSYDTGTSQEEDVGETVTDNDGYYSLITDVAEKGSFKEYIVLDNGNGISKSSFVGGSYDNSGDVLINGTVKVLALFSFHIKNVSPQNASDLFDSLAVSDTTVFDYYEGLNLKGMTVDTFLTRQLYIDNSTYYFHYTYRKSGITSSGYNSIAANCLDTTRVNIFY